jgi:hypothetical protein
MTWGDRRWAEMAWNEMTWQATTHTAQCEAISELASFSEKTEENQQFPDHLMFQNTMWLFSSQKRKLRKTNCSINQFHAPTIDLIISQLTSLCFKVLEWSDHSQPNKIIYLFPTIHQLLVDYPAIKFETEPNWSMIDLFWNSEWSTTESSKYPSSKSAVSPRDDNHFTNEDLSRNWRWIWNCSWQQTGNGNENENERRNRLEIETDIEREEI